MPRPSTSFPRPAQKRRRRGASADGFVADEAGLAAVEFAFVLPIMLLVYFGLVEIASGVRASQQLDLVAHTVGDLVGQLPQHGSGPAQLTDNGSTSSGQQYGIQQVFAAATALMQPFPTSSMQITVSEVLISLGSTAGTYQANVDWTVASNSTAVERNAGGACASGVALGATTITPGSSALAFRNNAPVDTGGISTSFNSGNAAPGPYIVTDIVYTYTPKIMLVSNLFGGAGGLTMKRTTYNAVRNTYYSSSYPYLYNHIQYQLSTTPNGTNCLPIP
ncbi:MAG TPA: TadE/TadG family type IV pilus assembly protein [Methylocystis sp.]|nr:TadE/TadG family type IV pilus assembly protein [Methylocystis sp.]